MRILLTNKETTTSAPVWEFNSDSEAERAFSLFKYALLDSVKTVYYHEHDIMHIYLTQDQVQHLLYMHCKEDLGIDFSDLKKHLTAIIN